MRIIQHDLHHKKDRLYPRILPAMNKDLIKKYNVAGPRYTSYPTVPYWENDSFSVEAWKTSLINSFQLSNRRDGISIYIHLPYCESLCTFCGCHKRITKRHDVEQPYIETLLKEWELYLALFPEKPIIRELHLGGGTPTFFSPENLQHLLSGLFKKASIHPLPEFSFEGHPNSTGEAHLNLFNQFGFTRVSFGVQDYNPHIQKAIHRIQSFEQVKFATETARRSGYTSVSHDLVYGLPFQKIEAIQNTIRLTLQLMPDRISLYSYAHVPWLKGNGQRGFKDEDVPKDKEKQALYETAKEMLLQAGYAEIGMDHFAKKTDTLYTAYRNNTLHRNFMGYTASKTRLMIGLGCSSISDSYEAYAQNEKEIEGYTELVNSGNLPVVKGHLLNREDITVKQHILDLMCSFSTNWQESKLQKSEKEQILNELQPLLEDELVSLAPDQLYITEKGKMFVRNACMAFDLRLKRKLPQSRIFSSTI